MIRSMWVCYKSWTGERLNGEQLKELFTCLQKNDLADYSHILTGYIGTESCLKTVVEVVSSIKKKNQNIIYVCDPVLGDDGHLYVPAELVPLYLDEVMPLADFLTPNQFEAEQLTGIKIECWDSAEKALNFLLKRGPKAVILTSVSFKNDDRIHIFGMDQENNTYKNSISKIEGYFTGTGDLFSALLLAWIDIDNGNLESACKKVVSTLQAVLMKTKDHFESSFPDQDFLNAIPKFRELKLIQSKAIIESGGTCDGG
eukprot:Pgem_evm1s10827